MSADVGAGDGAGDHPAGDERLLALLGRRHRGVVATIRPDGRPHLSTVDHTWDPGSGVLRFSTTVGTAKVRNLNQDHRASYYVATEDGSSYVVADTVVQLSPVATHRDDATVEELIEVYRAVQGEHPDWDEYRDAMVADRRLVVRLAVQRVYGWLGRG